MPDSEKPADNGGKKPFHKRRRFRKNRGERTEQQQNSQTDQDQSGGQTQPNSQSQRSGQSGSQGQPNSQSQRSGQSGSQGQPNSQSQRSGQSGSQGQPNSQSQRSGQGGGQARQNSQSQRSGQGGGQGQPNSQSGSQGQQSSQGQRSRFQDKSQNRHRDNRNKLREKAPSWDAEESLKAPPLPDTKEELRQVLEAVNPEELMMTPLFQKRKYTNPTPESIEETLIPDDLLLDSGSRVAVDVVNACPICDKPIREVMYALHDYEHNKLAHFDCVFKKVSDSLQDKLTDQRHLAYLGSGAFGIMEPIPNKPNRERLVEKIYPGAPVEELLHAGENQPDEEL